MKKYYAVIPVLLSVLSCSSATPTQSQVSKTNYTIVIDPSFTSSEVYDIVDAATSWQLVVPVQFTIQIAPSYCPSDGVFCISPGIDTHHFDVDDAGHDIPDDAGAYTPLGWTDWDFSNGEAKISIDQRAVSIGDVEFELVALHELGHAQGLVHHEGCYVMNAILTKCATQPTINDVDQWWELRQHP